MARNRDEPVRLTKIYTRGGDRGETSLGDGSRASKLDPRIGAYGAVDELTRARGSRACRTSCSTSAPDLSVPWEGEDDKLRTTQEQVDALEADCDTFNADLPELKSFVLPGGDEGAARIHVARAVCRRAERDALAAPVNPLAVVYLNRLSDLLFILARAANAAAGRDEPLWKPGSSR